MTDMKVDSVGGLAIGVNSVTVPTGAVFHATMGAVSGWLAYFSYDPSLGTTESRTILLVLINDPTVPVPDTATYIGHVTQPTGPFTPPTDIFVFAE